jgi:Na+/H+-dicarboxylate symporter
MIAPLIFASVVQGFAGTGDMKKARRIGVKALIYFEIVTTLALVVGLFMVNLLKPGAGVTLVTDATQSTAGLAKPLTLVEIILHAFPTSLMDSMARNDVLQIVIFAVLFAMAVIAAGSASVPPSRSRSGTRVWVRSSPWPSWCSRSTAPLWSL